VIISSGPVRPPVSVYTLGLDADHPILSNQLAGGANVRDTGIAIMSGDRIEIKPTCIFRGNRKAADPKKVRVDNDVCAQSASVCVSSEPVIEHRCDDQCHACVKCQVFPPVCYPWRCCDNVCEDVTVGTRCIRYEQRCVQHENQWRELTTYPALAPVEVVRDDLPMTKPDVLLNSIKLRFLLAKGGEVVCPLVLFKPESDSEKFSFQVGNVTGCGLIFATGDAATATLGVVNEIAEPLHYAQGRCHRGRGDERTQERGVRNRQRQG
jgi:hypothetical protein